MKRKILTKKEVALILRLKSTTTIDSMVRKGIFMPGFHRAGRLLGWYEDEVYDWIDKNKGKQNL